MATTGSKIRNINCGQFSCTVRYGMVCNIFSINTVFLRYPLEAPRIAVVKVETVMVLIVLSLKFAVFALLMEDC